MVVWALACLTLAVGHCPQDAIAEYDQDTADTMSLLQLSKQLALGSQTVSRTDLDLQAQLRRLEAAVEQAQARRAQLQWWDNPMEQEARQQETVQIERAHAEEALLAQHAAQQAALQPSLPPMAMNPQETAPWQILNPAKPEIPADIERTYAEEAMLAQQAAQQPALQAALPPMTTIPQAMSSLQAWGRDEVSVAGLEARGAASQAVESEEARISKAQKYDDAGKDSQLPVWSQSSTPPLLVHPEGLLAQTQAWPQAQTGQVEGLEAWMAQARAQGQAEAEVQSQAQVQTSAQVQAWAHVKAQALAQVQAETQAQAQAHTLAQTQAQVQAQTQQVEGLEASMARFGEELKAASRASQSEEARVKKAEKYAEEAEEKVNTAEKKASMAEMHADAAELEATAAKKKVSTAENQLAAEHAARERADAAQDRAERIASNATFLLQAALKDKGDAEAAVLRMAVEVQATAEDVAQAEKLMQSFGVSQVPTEKGMQAVNSA